MTTTTANTAPEAASSGFSLETAQADIKSAD